MFGGKMEMLKERAVISPNKKHLALLTGNFHTAHFHGMSENYNRIINLYSHDKKEPVYVSLPDQYVFSGPVFSSNSKYLAFSTANNLRQVALTLGDDDEAGALDVAAWEERISVIDLENLEIHTLGEEEVHGYGEWSMPKHFMLGEFVDNDTVIFATSATEAGIVGIWNIIVDTKEAFYFENPHLFTKE